MLGAYGYQKHYGSVKSTDAEQDSKQMPDRLMGLVKLAMMLEIEYGIRTHMRFEIVDGQGEPIVDEAMQGGQGEVGS